MSATPVPLRVHNYLPWMKAHLILILELWTNRAHNEPGSEARLAQIRKGCTEKADRRDLEFLLNLLPVPLDTARETG